MCDRSFSAPSHGCISRKFASFLRVLRSSSFATFTLPSVVAGLLWFLVFSVDCLLSCFVLLVCCFLYCLLSGCCFCCLLGWLFVCLLLLVVVLLLLCMMEVTLGFRLKNSSLQQLLCVKPLLQGRFRILDISSASQKLWPSNRQTCWFLVWYGLLVMFYCAAGHQWKSFNSNSEKENLFLHCTERIPNPDHHSDDEDDEVPKRSCAIKSSRGGVLARFPTTLRTTSCLHSI